MRQYLGKMPSRLLVPLLSRHLNKALEVASIDHQLVLMQRNITTPGDGTLRVFHDVSIRELIRILQRARGT